MLYSTNQNSLKCLLHISEPRSCSSKQKFNKFENCGLSQNLNENMKCIIKCYLAECARVCTLFLKIKKLNLVSCRMQLLGTRTRKQVKGWVVANIMTDINKASQKRISGYKKTLAFLLQFLIKTDFCIQGETLLIHNCYRKTNDS